MHDEFQVGNNYNMTIGIEIILVIFIQRLFIFYRNYLRGHIYARAKPFPTAPE